MNNRRWVSPHSLTGVDLLKAKQQQKAENTGRVRKQDPVHAQNKDEIRVRANQLATGPKDPEGKEPGLSQG